MVLPRRTTRFNAARPAASAPSSATRRGPAADPRTATKRTAVSPEPRGTRTRGLAADAPRQKLNPALLWVTGGLGVLLLVLVGVMMSGRSGGEDRVPRKKPAPAAPAVDVSGLIREAAKRGDAGIKKAKDGVDLYERERNNMTEACRREVVRLLEDAKGDLEAAMTNIDQASNAAPGKFLGVDDRKYTEMLKEVRRHLLELKR
jgi:hypothetical protein